MTLYEEVLKTAEVWRLNDERNKVQKKVYRCPECGKPLDECDPDGIGHYRG